MQPWIWKGEGTVRQESSPRERKSQEEEGKELAPLLHQPKDYLSSTDTERHPQANFDSNQPKKSLPL